MLCGVITICAAAAADAAYVLCGRIGKREIIELINITVVSGRGPGARQTLRRVFFHNVHIILWSAITLYKCQTIPGHNVIAVATYSGCKTCPHRRTVSSRLSGINNKNSLHHLLLAHDDRETHSNRKYYTNTTIITSHLYDFKSIVENTKRKNIGRCIFGRFMTRWTFLFLICLIILNKNQISIVFLSAWFTNDNCVNNIVIFLCLLNIWMINI